LLDGAWEGSESGAGRDDEEVEAMAHGLLVFLVGS